MEDSSLPLSFSACDLTVTDNGMAGTRWDTVPLNEPLWVSIWCLFLRGLGLFLFIFSCQFICVRVSVSVYVCMHTFMAQTVWGGISLLWPTVGVCLPHEGRMLNTIVTSHPRLRTVWGSSLNAVCNWILIIYKNYSSQYWDIHVLCFGLEHSITIT